MPGHRLILGIFVSVLIVWAGAMAFAMRQAALPPEAAGPLLAVFEPGTPEDAIFAAVVNAGGRPVRATWLPFVWVVAGEEAGLAGRIEAAGALGTYSELAISPSLEGCFAYADTKIAELFVVRP
jgi:hypothetical protein